LHKTTSASFLPDEYTVDRRRAKGNRGGSQGETGRGDMRVDKIIFKCIFQMKTEDYVD
jgi:hypothetical protein